LLHKVTLGSIMRYSFCAKVVSRCPRSPMKLSTF